ncbi:hypothetical protein M0802_002259 [Mischocyttarus mexicanus]|nr:hypothetical protein M0802_002259 [Mischocyttarus mexicanus]
MSRHRDVRCMNYSDEYDGYDDVYGHSVEDDYCVSPSAEQFLFDRSKQQNIASFIMEPDIVEDNEDDNSVSSLETKKLNLTELEKAKLLSCMETLKNIIGDSLAESKLEEEIIRSGFNTKVALDKLLIVISEQNIAEESRCKECLNASPGSTSSYAISKCLLSKKSIIPTAATNIIDSGNNFSSLAEMIASHANSKQLFSHDSKSECFGSLADLTANHFKKSNISLNKTKPSTESYSNSNFIIPKLNINKTKDNSGHNVVSSGLGSKDNMDNTVNIKNNINETQFCADKVQIDSLRKHISNIKLTSDSNSEFNEQKSINLTNLMERNVDCVRTQSPDNGLIDLTIALKEVHVINSKNIRQIEPITYQYYDTLSYIEKMKNSLFIDSVSEKNPKCTLNLNNLIHTRLPYAKKTPSFLGKVLARKMKLKKPFLSVKKQGNLKFIKRFDFSTPYTR